MTRLQNAKKQLSEALLTLELSVSQAINESSPAGASANPSQMDREPSAGSDLLVLVNEVSKIEAKLNEAIDMIAAVASGPTSAGMGESRTTPDEGTK